MKAARIVQLEGIPVTRSEDAVVARSVDNVKTKVHHDGKWAP